MKRVFISLLTAVFLLSFLPCAALEYYTDSFQSVLSSDIASYQGAYRIENGLFSSIGWNPPDSDGLLLTQNGSRACVTYQISGADSVSFSLDMSIPVLSREGSFNSVALLVYTILPIRRKYFSPMQGNGTESFMT